MTGADIIRDAKKTNSAIGLFHEGFEGYFDQHKQRLKPTDGDYSQAPQLERHEFVEYLREFPQGFDVIKTNMHKHYAQFYDQWALELLEYHSLCFYGVGSKLELIRLFLDHWSPQEPIIVVNAYNPVTVKEIINYCVSSVVEDSVYSKWLKQPNERLTLFHEYLTNNPQISLVLVVHNIDGFSIREDKSLELLCRLVSHPSLKFIASTEHIEAPILWSSYQLSQLGFVWHNVTTFEPAIHEHAYQDVANFGKSGAKGIKTVDIILSSLTANAKKLFKLLLESQYEIMVRQKVEKSTLCKLSHGVKIPDLFEMCLQDFIVSSESTLQRLLDEYSSHDLVKIGRNKDGVEIVFIKGSFSDIINLMKQQV